MKLSQYFCEDESKFRLEDCVAVFATLNTKVADAKKVSAPAYIFYYVKMFMLNIYTKRVESKYVVIPVITGIIDVKNISPVECRRMILM